MKSFKNYFLIILLAGVFFSCGDDDDSDSTCKQVNYIGTWVGPENCTVGAGNSSVTITIVAKGDDIELDGGAFETDVVSVDAQACTVEGSNSTFGFSFEYTGSLDGDNLLLTHRRIVAGVTGNVCTYTLERQ